MIEFFTPNDLTVPNLKKAIWATTIRFGYALSDNEKEEIVSIVWKRLTYPQVPFEAGGCRNYHVWVMTRVRSAVDTYFGVHKVTQLHGLREVSKHTLNLTEERYRRFVDDHTNESKLALSNLYATTTSTSHSHEKLHLALLLRPCKKRTRFVVQQLLEGNHPSLNQVLLKECRVTKNRMRSAKQEIVDDLIKHGVTPESILHG